VDRPWAGEGTARGIGASAQGIGNTVLGQAIEAGNRFYRCGLGFGKPSAGYFGVVRPLAGGEDLWLPIPDVTEMPGIVIEAAHLPGIGAWNIPCAYPNRIAIPKIVEALCFG